VAASTQGNQLSGKPENVREFDSCQGNVRDFTKSHGKISSGKSCLKLFIVSCIFASIQVFSTSLFCVLSTWFRMLQCCIPTPTTDSNTSTGVMLVTLDMPSGKCPGLSHCLESGHPVYLLLITVTHVGPGESTSWPDGVKAA